jgi:hypothetical protein
MQSAIPLAASLTGSSPGAGAVHAVAGAAMDRGGYGKRLAMGSKEKRGAEAPLFRPCAVVVRD